MKVVTPIAMTDAQLLSSNVTENDYPAWSDVTTYDAGDFVISTTTHLVYQSAVGSNLNHDPTDSDNIGVWWIEYSSTNRWKAFDSKLADRVSRSGTITYSIAPTSITNAIVFFNIGAPEVRVQVYDDTIPATEVFDETQATVDDSDIIDWYTFFTTDLSDSYVENAIFTGFTAYPGYQIDITIGDGTGTALVGEIAYGKVISLGVTLEDTEIGLDSFSTKIQDDFGNWSIVSRAKSDPVEFLVSAPATDAGRIKRKLTDLRDTAAVYYADESLLDLGALTYGFFQSFRIPLKSGGNIFYRLEIEGLT